jgi:hypothetical protein
MRHIAHHTGLDRWHWLMWILAALLAMAFLFSSITANESNADDLSGQGLSLRRPALSGFVTENSGTGSSTGCIS